MSVSYKLLAPFQAYDAPVSLNELQWNTERHTVKIRNRLVVLTPTEYRILYPLKEGLPLTYGNLAEITYHYTADEKVRVMMDKHIDRIRGKLRGTGIYVYCVLNYGYMLLAETPLGNADSYHA